MTMNRITAPYGFVPLSERIVFPSWLQPRATREGEAPRVPPLHDVPFRDGIRGTLELLIHAETPLFTRGASGDPSQPFQLPDGTYAIPGTAVRGALRNVIEIATFGRFDRVNKSHRYAVRDLNNRHLYGQFMADIVKNPRTGKQEPMPLVSAGFLRQTRDETGKPSWTIEVCDFGKIEYGRLVEIAQGQGIGRFQPGVRQSSVRKYEAWQGKSLDIRGRLDVRRPEAVGARRMASKYGVAAPDVNGQPGRLVFTGQPNRWDPHVPKPPRAGNPKHHDFVFFPTAARRRLPVTAQTFEDFEFAHSDRGQQNRLGKSQTPNEEWGFWQPILESGKEIPVFFLTDDRGEKVEAFGLAMMFRLPYRHNIGQAIQHVHADHVRAGAGLDFADGVFGTVQHLDDGQSQGSRPGIWSLKGRVGISHAKAEPGVQPGAPIQVILGAPKASYYPNYVEQDPQSPGSPPPHPPGVRDPQYRTWNDGDCRPRGWKRYRALTKTWQPRVPSGADGRPVDLARVGTTFRPLPEGTVFRAHVDLHNLRPEEIGALLWAMDFGGDQLARHTLGMARPLGYGRARFSVGGHQLRTNEDRPADLDACRKAFLDYMESQVPGWRNTPQMKELLALARPVAPEEAYYQRLDPGQRVNEFVEAKKMFLALPSAADHGRRGGARPGPVAAPAQSSGAPSRSNLQPSGRPQQAGRGPARPTSSGPLKKPGDRIEIRLIELSRKGKWQCTAPEFPNSKGTIQGDPPGEVAPGEVHTVSVVSLLTPTNMVLSWKPE